MRFVVYFVLFLIILGVSAYLVFLNHQPISLLLTPRIGEYIYTTYPMPLGLLVLLFFFAGLLFGYLLRMFLK
ncbi:MAG: hypothetical protein ACPLRS_03765 [Hydrogenobacter sp.]